MDIVTRVREAAAKRVLFLPHAIRRMMHPDRMITSGEVLNTIRRGELVEDYPDDVRGHSCLLLGFGVDDRPVYVVRSPKDEYLAIITAYLPGESEWEPDHKTRRRR